MPLEITRTLDLSETRPGETMVNKICCLMFCKKKSVYYVTYLRFAVSVILDLNVVTPTLAVVPTIATTIIILNMPWSPAEAEIRVCKKHTAHMSILYNRTFFLLETNADIYYCQRMVITELYSVNYPTRHMVWVTVITRSKNQETCITFTLPLSTCC